MDEQRKTGMQSNEPERTGGTAAIAGRTGRAENQGTNQQPQREPNKASAIPAGVSIPITQEPSGAGAAAAPARAKDEQGPPLLLEDEASNLRYRWSQIQIGFVDEPRSAVQKADQLVADAIQRLAETFADERKRLEEQWDRGGDVSTEDLRLALQHYRSFFGRLLSI